MTVFVYVEKCISILCEINKGTFSNFVIKKQVFCCVV